MVDPKNVVLSEDELDRCREFSEKSARNQQRAEFGQKTTAERSLREIARDNMIGKIAEVAVAKIIEENYGVKVELDFNCYPRGEWDEQDVLINGWRIDIKGVRAGAKWLLVEWNKLAFRQKYGNLSHAYVACTVGWDREKDEPTGWVRLEGVASLYKMRRGCKTTTEFKKGDLIPGTSTHLQADNYGIRFSDLTRDVNCFVNYIMRNPPPDGMVGGFRNPYLT